MNQVSSDIIPEAVHFKSLDAGECFDTSPPPGMYGYCLMKTNRHTYVSLINGNLCDWPEEHDPKVWAAPKGTVITIVVGTRDK